jgi:thiamine pyrophosphokinase
VPARAAHAVILADGAAPSRVTLDAAWPGWDAGIDLVVAADGGLRHAAAFGFHVDRWVGDGDSTSQADLDAVAAAGAVIDRVAVDKDESDTELALRAAVAAGPDEVTILGALGGVRTDHALANIGLLQHQALEGRRARMYDEHGARLTLLVGPDHLGLAGRAELHGRLGDLVSILPIGETAYEVSTEGLRFPLDDEPLVIGRARGLSNVRIAQLARVSVASGRLLLIETPATIRP